MSKFYYGDKVRVSNTLVADGTYGTVIGKIREIDQFSSNKENSDAFSYLVKLDDIGSALYTIRGENCHYVWGHESENADCVLVKKNELEHCKTTYPKNIMLEFDGNTITAHGLEEYKKYVGKGGCFYSGRLPPTKDLLVKQDILTTQTRLELSVSWTDTVLAIRVLKSGVTQ